MYSILLNSNLNVSYLAFHKDGDDDLSLNQYNKMPLILSNIWAISIFYKASNHYTDITV